MQGKNDSERLSEEIPFYLQCSSSQDSLLQSYRMLFIAMEAVFFGLAFVSYQIEAKEFLWFPAISGITLCGAWIFVCTHRGCMVDRLKEALEQLLGGKSIKPNRWFDISYGKAGGKECIKKPLNLLRAFIGPSEKWVPRVSFNLVSPALLIALWAFIGF